MSTTLQDTLRTLADGAAARAGRSDDEAHRATLAGLLGTVRRRRAVRHTGTAVAGASLVGAIAVGGSQLTGGDAGRVVPGATGGGDLSQAAQLALVNDLGVECGKPFTLSRTNPAFTSPGMHQPRKLIGSQQTGFSLPLGLGNGDQPPETTPWAFATVITEDGQVVGFAAGRPDASTLVKGAEGYFDLRLRLPSLKNCGGADAATPDGAYQLYVLEAKDDAAGVPRLTGVLGPAELPIVNGTPGYPPDSTSWAEAPTDSNFLLGHELTIGSSTMAWTPPDLGGRELVIQFEPDGSFPHDANGTIQLWTRSGTDEMTPYDGGTFTASYVATTRAVEMKKDGVLLTTMTIAPR